MNPEEIESDLRRQFEAELRGRVERYSKSRVHGVIPNGYFATASSECRDLYVGGQFYGCITLAQSVAEGLAKFIAEKNGIGLTEDHRQQINHLQRNRSTPAISTAAYSAFRQIIGRPHEDRNDFHHLNADVEQDYFKLEARALECIEALYVIESEVFAFQLNVGRIIPTHSRYWPQDDENLHVFVRF